MNIIKAERRTVKFCEGVEVDGYMLPDGEFRVGKVGASVAIGYVKNYLAELEKKSPTQFKTLQNMGYVGEIVMIQLETIKGGGSYAPTISEVDFNILTAFAASQGKETP